MCAVLIGDVSGYSALVGEDDERTARAVEALQSAVRAVVSEAKGYAEARAGDAIFASFDSVVAAVQAALAIQRRAAEEEFAGQRLRVRIGVHFGDVLVREGASIGEGVGDAINIAARLEALARPGTVCISEGVYLQVRKKFDEPFVDLGSQQLKNIPYPVRAYLVVPGETAAAPVRAVARPALRWGAAAVLLLVLALGAGLMRPHWPALPGRPAGTGEVRGGQARAGHPDPTLVAPLTVGVADRPGQVTLGVMLFKGLGAQEGTDWRREALRDGLNAQLSQLSHVKVYSKEFLDFLISRKGLTEIEAASQLGISKMLSGSFVVLNGTLRIETHVVDVKTGVLESSYTTSAREADFPTLQTQLALDVIAHLELPVTDAEKHVLLAQRTTDTEALKMLLEAEGGAAPPHMSPPHTPALGPRSARPQWLAFAFPFGAAPACASDTAANAAILDALERYRRAMMARDLEALAALYAEFPPDQRAAQQRYFDNVRDLKVSIDSPDIAVVGGEAVVSYTRTDDFVDARTGRPMHVSVRLTKVLRLQNGTWKLVGK